MKQKIKLLPIVAVLALLTACGGGGDDAPASDGNAGGNPGAVAAPASSYAGNWKIPGAACEQDEEILINDRPAHTSVGPITSTLTSDGFRLTGELKIFDNSTCAGAARAIQNYTSVFKIDGKATIGGKEVDRVSFKDQALGGFSAGNRVILNGVSYPGDYFTRAEEGKGLSYLEGNKWFLDAEEGAAYPTALDTEPLFERL